MPSDKKGQASSKVKLEEKKVRELRKMAGRTGAKQTNPDGSTKNKKELIKSLMKAKK